MRARKLSTLMLGATLAVAMTACGKDDTPVSTAGGAAQTATTTPVTVALATTTTAAPQTTVKTANTALGTIFVDVAGKTLYTWDRDTGPTSTCTGNCAATWPPLTDSIAPTGGTAGNVLTLTGRPDDAAKMQVAWNGKPLYYYAADTAPGETKGDNVGGTWHVARPA